MNFAECTNGTYGPGCLETCECRNNATCDHVSGSCECKPGWRGRHCSKGRTSYMYLLLSNVCRPSFLHHVLLSNICRPSFLAPLVVGQRAYVIVRCPSCVRPSVLALTFSLNIFSSETTYRILMKFHRNVPALVLFRISSKTLILSKTVVAMATKLKKN